MTTMAMASPSDVTKFPEPVETKMFGINLGNKPRWFQLLLCSSAVFFGFLLNGVCEEFVFKQLEFGYAWYFTLVQSLVYLVLAYIHGFRLSDRRQKWSAYLWISIALVGTTGLTKASLSYINYPAQVIFKSSKVIPVMVMGAFIPGQRRTYSAREYVSAVVLVVGLIVFTLADASAAPTVQLAGVIMIVSSLVFDAFLGNLQESMFAADPLLSQQEVLFCTTVVGIPFLLPPLLMTGELSTAWESGLKYPLVYPITAVAAVATYIGQLAILTLIYMFGAATTYVVTSLRKALTLALSYIIFTKPFTFGHFIGFILIASSLSMKAIPPRKSSPQTYERVPTADSSGKDEKESLPPRGTALRSSGTVGNGVMVSSAAISKVSERTPSQLEKNTD